MSREWTLSPYAVALLLDAPTARVADAMMRVYDAAEAARRACGQHPGMPTGKAVHAVFVAHVANDLAANGNDDELCEWLLRAADVLVLDAGLDLEAMAAPTEPPGARQHHKP